MISNSAIKFISWGLVIFLQGCKNSDHITGSNDLQPEIVSQANSTNGNMNSKNADSSERKRACKSQRLNEIFSLAQINDGIKKIGDADFMLVAIHFDRRIFIEGISDARSTEFLINGKHAIMLSPSKEDIGFADDIMDSIILRWIKVPPNGKWELLHVVVDYQIQQRLSAADYLKALLRQGKPFVVEINKLTKIQAGSAAELVEKMNALSKLESE